MTRRYLSAAEANSALVRGERVEAFLGGDIRQGQPVIRYTSLWLDGGSINATVWEVADPQEPGFLDVYSFYPVGHDDEPLEAFTFPDLDEAIAALELYFPGIAERFVIAGVIQDEYAEYLASELSAE